MAVVAVILAVALPVLTTLAAMRLSSLVGRHRNSALRTAAVLGIVWVVCAAFAVQIVPGVPVAATSVTRLAYDRVGQVAADLWDQRALGVRSGSMPSATSRRTGCSPRCGARTSFSPSSRVTGGWRWRTQTSHRRSMRCSPLRNAASTPKDSPLAVLSSPRRRRVAAVGWRTPPCSPGCGLTPRPATAPCSKATASRSARPSARPAGAPSA